MRIFCTVLILCVIVGFACQPHWLATPGTWVEDAASAVAEFQEEQFGHDAILSYRLEVLGLASVVLISLLCGALSSLVVSNRMAFFSDALAHCAYAGVALGALLLLAGIIGSIERIVSVTIVFGVIVGLAIAFVRDKTSLASDTVIGVFFAGAMGFGTVLLSAISARGVRNFDAESFLFGDPIINSGIDLLFLAMLLVAVIGLMCLWYNEIVFTSFNPSLARSRLIPTRFANYLLVILLALVINVSIPLVGLLLVSAMLVVPAAAATNLATNLRSFFWYSIGFSVVAGVGGVYLNYSWQPRIYGETLKLGLGGTIVLIAVLLFFASMALMRLTRGARPAPRTGF